MKKISVTFFLVIMIFITDAQSHAHYPIRSRQLEIDSLKQLLASSGVDTHRVTILSDLAIRSSRSNHQDALRYAHEGLKLSRKLNFRKGEADCLRRSGIVFAQEGRYPEALKIYQQALRISEDVHDSFGVAAGLGHIGEIYAEQGDYRNARFYFS